MQSLKQQIFTDITTQLYAAHYEHVTDPTRNEILRRVLTGHLTNICTSTRRVLDMGCGIGQITDLLHSAGYDVIGIDNSLEMQAEAKRRFPNARFLMGDIKDYSDENVDCILCFGETMNYLGSTDDLYIALRRFADNLRVGGSLIAELLDPQDLYVGWADTTYFYHMEDGWFAIFDYSNLGEGRGEWKTRWLRRLSSSALAESHSSTIVLKTWRPAELVEAARACGFSDAEVFDLARGGPVREETISQLLVAKK